MGFTVREKPKGERVQESGFVGVYATLRCFQDSEVEIDEPGTRMSPQVLLPSTLCLPRGSRLEGEASARSR
jgi:hypothetical protein